DEEFVGPGPALAPTKSYRAGRDDCFWFLHILKLPDGRIHAAAIAEDFFWDRVHVHRKSAGDVEYHFFRRHGGAGLSLRGSVVEDNVRAALFLRPGIAIRRGFEGGAEAV